MGKIIKAILLAASLSVFYACNEEGVVPKWTRPAPPETDEDNEEFAMLPDLSYVQNIPPAGTLDSVQIGQIWTTDRVQLTASDAIYCGRSYIWSTETNIVMDPAEFIARGSPFAFNINFKITDSGLNAQEFNIRAPGSAFEIEFTVTCNDDFKLAIRNAQDMENYPYIEIKELLSQYFNTHETIATINGSLKIYPSLDPVEP